MLDPIGAAARASRASTLRWAGAAASSGWVRNPVTRSRSPGWTSVSSACAMRGSLVAQAQTTSSAAFSVGETIIWNRAVPGLAPGVGTVSR